MEDLVKLAIQAREKAYAPYSNFKVGAAVRTIDGSVYTGCNVENSSLGLTICAERLAIWKAVSDGHLKFDKVAIVADTEGPCRPCGACRQTLLEFGGDMEIVMANLDGQIETMKLSELVPKAFTHYKKS
jgi:cytidine deaminase